MLTSRLARCQWYDAGAQTNGRVTRRGAEFLAYYMQGDGEGKDWDYHVDFLELPAEVQYSIAVREDNLCEASLPRGWRVGVAEPMKLRSGFGGFWGVQAFNARPHQLVGCTAP